MSSKAMIMYDSPEAASYRTGIEGWVSSGGHFYGKDEHMARWAGSTHRKCGKCGAVMERNSYCRPCHDRKMDEKFAGYPVEKWDGVSPLCVFDDDTYFFDEDSLLDYLADLEDGYEPRICKCKSGYLHLIDADTWCDDLPEDGELPAEIEAAIDALNAAIKNAGPVCWYEDKIAIDVSEWLAVAREESDVT
jgi:hypothetical protein